MMETDEDLLNAILYAMHYIASADGVLTPEEIDIIAHVVSEVAGLIVTNEQIVSVSSALEANAEDTDTFWKGVFAKYDAMTIGNRQTILKCAIMTAAADGEYQNEEHTGIINIGDWLGLTPDQIRSALDKVERDTKLID